MSVIGNTFIIVSGHPQENSDRYVITRITLYRNLKNTFNAIEKMFRGNVTFTVNIDEFIRDYTGRDFKPVKVGYLGDESEDESIVVKCVYRED